jgi:tRNA nucleotidyltransferase (CCA-adding enzyme)
MQSEPENNTDWMERLRRQLPEAHRVALDLVLAQNIPVYLVGGIVRDLLLGQPNFDLDFVTLQPASVLARRVLPLFEQRFGRDKVKLLEHSAFGTARLDANQDLHLDFATARHETYAHPAALPTVSFPATLEEDLHRRDFTINAIALTPDGSLHDPFNGLKDLREGVLRVLHPASFIDDPTRMVRGVRFAARLDYKFEPETEQLLKEALKGGYFSLLSAERKRNELRLILKEARPEKALILLEHYGLLAKIHPYLDWPERNISPFWYLDYYSKNIVKRKLEVYASLAIIFANLGKFKVEQIVRDLRFVGLEASVPVEVAQLWTEVRSQLVPGLKNSQLYNLLHSYSSEALQIFEARLLGKAKEQKLVRHYRKEVAGRKPILNGDYLIKLGVPPGPHIKTLLAELRDAVLDGEVKGREEEEAFLQRRIKA